MVYYLSSHKKSFYPHNTFNNFQGSEYLFISDRSKLFLRSAIGASYNSLFNLLRQRVLNLYPINLRSSKAFLNLAQITSHSFFYIKKLCEAFAPTVRVLVIRGIGYRAYLIYNDNFFVSADNDLSENSMNLEKLACFWALLSNIWPRYIFIRVGQSYPTYLPLYSGVGVRKKRRGRKVVLYGFNKYSVTLMRDLVYKLKKPDMFTGRGIRCKGWKYRRKPGKRSSRVW